MKPGPTRIPRLLIVFAIVGVTVALVSWQRKQGQDKQYRQLQETADTIPQNKERKIRDLDEAIAELEAVDISREMEKAMKDVDKALKELDIQKIEQEVKESMAKIDWDKMQADLDRVKNIDLKEMEAGLQKAREEMKKIGPQLEKDLQKAKLDIEKAKSELKEYKSFVDGLENDGLINKKEGYSIEHKNGKLTINDKEASPQTYQKYRSFLDQHKKFSIEKDE